MLTWSRKDLRKGYLPLTHTHKTTALPVSKKKDCRHILAAVNQDAHEENKDSTI